MAAELPKDVKVGDKLILVTNDRYRGDEPVTVSRIGRQYLYIARNGREARERFDRRTGVEYGNVGIRAALYTQEQYDEMKQRTALFADLRTAGLDIRYEVRSEMSTGKLRALLAVVQDDADRATEK